MTRAWVINGYDGYQGLSLEEFPEEVPGPGEVRLKIEAFALNWGDADLMLDRYSFSFPQFPAKIGMEAAGIVEAVGEGVEGIEIGERYCTLPYFYYNQGTSAEKAVVDARYITKAPEGLTAVESASVWMQFLTAYYPIVEFAKADPDKNILVTAGTSTAGTAALQIGRMMGANMISTTRYEYNRDYLKTAGAEHVFIADNGDLADFIREATGGKGINMAFDPIGGGMINQYAPAMSRDAEFVFYGGLDGTWPQVPLVAMWQTNSIFRAYSLFNYVENPEMLEKGLAFVYDALASGELKPAIDKVYPFEGYKEAWDYLRAPRQSHGKVVVEVGK
ncbi:MAG: zinc-dependent alcohol dehydrogenase family protein [Chloroflexota bacterium]